MNVLLESAQLLREHAQAYRESHTHPWTGRIDDDEVESDIAKHLNLATLLEVTAKTLGLTD